MSMLGVILMLTTKLQMPCQQGAPSANAIHPQTPNIQKSGYSTKSERSQERNEEIQEKIKYVSYNRPAPDARAPTHPTRAQSSTLPSHIRCPALSSNHACLVPWDCRARRQPR